MSGHRWWCEASVPLQKSSICQKIVLTFQMGSYLFCRQNTRSERAKSRTTGSYCNLNRAMFARRRLLSPTSDKPCTRWWLRRYLRCSHLVCWFHWVVNRQSVQYNCRIARWCSGLFPGKLSLCPAPTSQQDCHRSQTVDPDRRSRVWFHDQ